MKADIGRVSFSPANDFLRVIMQQGRVQLESDWNEQVSILLQAVRTLAADLIGPWGGSPGAFQIEPIAGAKGDFAIGAGHYYVDGILCDNRGGDKITTYLGQPHFPVGAADRLRVPQGGASHHLVYLDVWERLVTAAEDDDIREVALGGPDTAARSQLVWQVRAREFEENVLDGLDCQTIPRRWLGLLPEIESPQRGRLRARARVPEADIDRPCAIDPRASYRHDENALFRVEVHTPGPAGTATFKWSLDNGTVSFPVEWSGGTRVRLATLGRDPRLTLEAGDWVEFEDDSYVLQNRAEPLFVVKSVDYTDLMVTLDRAPASVPAGEHPRLRRWDQKGTIRGPLPEHGSLPISEATKEGDPWVDLRYGVQVQFMPPPADAGTTQYRTGDYWLIPARTAIGDVLWPSEPGPGGTPIPAARPPDGVEHHFAPLAVVSVADDATVTVGAALVRTIEPIAACPPVA